MKKTTILISSCIIFSICVLIVLNKMSNKSLHTKNEFIRFFPTHPLDLTANLDVKYNTYYISGTTAEHIYLGNPTALTHLSVTDYQLSDTSHLKLQVIDTGKLRSSNILTSVDFPHIYMKEGTTPAFYYGNLSKSNTITRHRLDNIFDNMYFDMAIPISPSSFVLRSYSDSLQQNILKKISADTSLIEAPNVLKKQIDGVFCTDGMLHYDPDSNLVVYVYFYRNEFICMDTDLNIIRKGKTIDTISQAQIKVASYSKGKRSTLSAPPLIVNKKSCIEKDRLYVNSGLLAKNENEETFKKHSVIDVYSLKDGRYQFSFYLPNFKGKIARSFVVSDKNIIALYDNYILTYKVKY